MYFSTASSQMDSFYLFPAIVRQNETDWAVNKGACSDASHAVKSATPNNLLQQASCFQYSSNYKKRIMALLI